MSYLKRRFARYLFLIVAVIIGANILIAPFSVVKAYDYHYVDVATKEVWAVTNDLLMEKLLYKGEGAEQFALLVQRLRDAGISYDEIIATLASIVRYFRMGSNFGFDDLVNFIKEFGRIHGIRPFYAPGILFAVGIALDYVLEDINPGGSANGWISFGTGTLLQVAYDYGLFGVAGQWMITPAALVAGEVAMGVAAVIGPPVIGYLALADATEAGNQQIQQDWNILQYAQNFTPMMKELIDSVRADKPCENGKDCSVDLHYVTQTWANRWQSNFNTNSFCWASAQADDAQFFSDYGITGLELKVGSCLMGQMYEYNKDANIMGSDHYESQDGFWTYREIVDSRRAVGECLTLLYPACQSGGGAQPSSSL